MSTSEPEPSAPESLPDVAEPDAVSELAPAAPLDDLATDAEFAHDEALAEAERPTSASRMPEEPEAGADVAIAVSEPGDRGGGDEFDGELDAAVEAMDFDGDVPDAGEYYGYDEVYPWETDDDGPRVLPKRHKGGGGVMLGAAMLGLRDVLYGKPKEDTAIEIEASGDPPNVDLDGLDMAIDENRRAVGPPLDDIKARAVQNRRSRRRPSAS